MKMCIYDGDACPEPARPPGPELGDFVLDARLSRLWVDGRCVDLARSAIALRILLVLAGTPGRPVTRRFLCEEVWPQEYHAVEADRRLFFNIHRLRRLIESDASRPRWLRTRTEARGYELALAGRVVVLLGTRDAARLALPFRLRRMLGWVEWTGRTDAASYACRARVSLRTARKDLGVLEERGLLPAAAGGS